MRYGSITLKSAEIWWICKPVQTSATPELSLVIHEDNNVNGRTDELGVLDTLALE